MRLSTGGLCRSVGPIQEGASRCGTKVIAQSHVNDLGFWLIQSFFKMDLKETLSTWTVLETVLSVAGLGMTLVLSAVLQ